MSERERMREIERQVKKARERKARKKERDK